MTPQWYDLGVKLLKEDQESHLDVIQSNHPNDNKTCCKEMFWYWLSTNTSATWKQLIDVLRSPAVELPIVAADLEKRLTGIVIIHVLMSRTRIVILLRAIG